MNSFLKRTNNTDLTDNELIIFDVLFDKCVPVRALEGGQDFSHFFDYSSHYFEIEQLRDFLNKQIKDGFMRIEIFSIKKQKILSAYIGLTEKGGEIWEKEREPDWDSYIIDYVDDINDSQELSVYSPSLRTAENFVNTCHNCKLYELKDPKEKATAKIDGHKVWHIPWKIFPELYEIKAILSNGGSNTDSDLYKKECVWWRNVNELIKLKKL